MTTERIVNRAVSLAALPAFDRAIRALLTDTKFAGVTTGKGSLRLIFHDAATDDDKDQAEQIALTHDITTRTPEQQEETQAKTDILEMLGTKAAQAIQQIQDDLTTLGGSPSNAQVIQIITRSLQREMKIIKALALMRRLAQ